MDHSCFSLRPAVAALSAGNPCILTLSASAAGTDELLLELIRGIRAGIILRGDRGGEQSRISEAPLRLLVFLTGSVGVGKVVMRAAAENLTPVLLELGGQNPAIVDEQRTFRTPPENCLGRDGVGRTVVHFPRLRGRS